MILARGKTLGYLAQQNMLAGHRSIYEEMLDSKKDIIQMEERLRSMEQDMKGQTGQKLEELMELYQHGPRSCSSSERLFL